ncbi:MAG: NAD-dependent epimerase/dehydratase family protein [Streptosporangiales bacterium]|nr:NAD-dependent epimerase/dehydratase family protein [Streptosporangiales bacterium]
MSILVTGGTGVVGGQVVSELLTRGAEEVRVLSRKAAPAVPEGATAARGDLTTGAGLAEAVTGVDTVVHCATNAGVRDTWADVAGTRRLGDAGERRARVPEGGGAEPAGARRAHARPRDRRFPRGRQPIARGGADRRYLRGVPRRARAARRSRTAPVQPGGPLTGKAGR